MWLISIFTEVEGETGSSHVLVVILLSQLAFLAQIFNDSDIS